MTKCFKINRTWAVKALRRSGRWWQASGRLRREEEGRGFSEGSLRP